jgi:threonine/homoserine/homoserine lactone efflux protein
LPDFPLLVAFALATAAIAVVPGPGLLYTAAQTLTRGRAAGLTAALGLHVGGYVHVLAAALGLAVVLRHVPEAYLVVKSAGAAYLVWLGVGLWRSSAPDALPRIAKTARRAFLESVSVEALNPKTALFYVAFLPQFVDPHAALPVAAQFLVLGVLANLTFSMADLAAVLFTGAMLRHIDRMPHLRRLARRIGGSLLIGLGARLALERT